VLARIPRRQLAERLRGYGWSPPFVEGDDPAQMHVEMARTLDAVLLAIRDFQTAARTAGSRSRPAWPMIVLATPKGWTGPTTVDGQQIEGTFRAHQIPLTAPRTNPAHLRLLEAWMRSYRPEELFTSEGRLRPEIAALAPSGQRRRGANPHDNGGQHLLDLVMPDFRT
jgi:xylulose-5-phosphate/fructose-6-phosphate phosphoketolase